MNVLVIATHFDDEVIGCGGTIAKHVAQGDQVYVCFICGGTSVRYPDEALVETRRGHGKAVCDVLGVKDVFFYDFPIIMLDTLPQLDLVTALEEVIFKVKPTILYTHYHDDMNSDHRAVYHASMVWCRPSKTPFLKKVYMYEIFGSTRCFHPNHYVVINDNIQDKLKALSMYTTENDVQTRTLETLEKQAQYRGAEVNQAYAEGFVIYRSIE